MRLLLFAALVILAGCASAPVDKRLGQTSPGIQRPAESNVMLSIRKMLDEGITVAIMIDCNAECSGIPQGQLPEEYGCTSDKETAADVEKYLLLEAFETYPNFSLVDRSKMDDSIKEIKLGMNGTTATTLQAGQFKGATHLLLIDSKDMLVRAGGRIEDHYKATKKLLDLQKNVLVAMDKINENHGVTFQPMLAERVAPPPQRPAQPRIENKPEPEQPVETPQPAIQPSEVIAIYGEPRREPETRRKYHPLRQEQNYETPQQPRSAYVNAADGAAINKDEPGFNSDRTVFVRNYVTTRIIKQRVAGLRNVDDRVIERRINTGNPGVLDKLKAGVPTPPR
jgi:hypothetical protein